MHLDHRTLFLQHVAQTSGAPMALEIVKSEGIFLFDRQGKKYYDLISGIGVSSLGHRHPAVLKAIREQLDHYLHLMVYGEYIEAPQVQLATLLCTLLPSPLQTVYFTNSGTEATEGALKLAKRFTGRAEIVSFRYAYHGSTQGALSVMGEETFRSPFRPLIPGNRMLRFNNLEDLDEISNATAAVICEVVQAEAGVIPAEKKFLEKLKNRCLKTGALLIFDECQTGLGRTGTLFGFEGYGIVPDILLLAKALGGGMPLGAFIASQPVMKSIAENPALGHITTFGGHPVCCAAGLAALRVLLDEKIVPTIKSKAALFRDRLAHSSIKAFRQSGLLMALEFESASFNQRVIQTCIENGLITDWFLFAPDCLRLAPPLTISVQEIEESCSLILQSLEAVYQQNPH